MSDPNKLIREAPRDLPTILSLETPPLKQFTADDAYALGTALRTRLRTLSPSPAVINITLSNSTLLYHATSHPGIQPDNDIWVARKRKTVLRWGVSSWGMRMKILAGMKGAGGDVEEGFARKFMLGDRAGEYAVHGGGVPVRVQGVEGVVAVVVVSGLKQEEDHMVVIEALEELRGAGGN